MSSYGGQEVFNIAIMSYKNLPAYAQQQIDRILQPVTIISQNTIEPSRTSWNLLETGGIFWSITEPGGT